jgi:hypothetical protein
MSYCRFVEADAYIYDDAFYGLYCSSCSLMPIKNVYNSLFKKNILGYQSFIAGSDYDKMLAHITEHRAADHYIPLDVDKMLIEERDNLYDS